MFFPAAKRTNGEKLTFQYDSVIQNREIKPLIAETAHGLVSKLPLQQSYYPSRFPTYRARLVLCYVVRLLTGSK